jgi:toxin ParE1/3/4
MMRLIITPLAQRDLETIGDYIAEDNPARAATFIRELRNQCNKIQQTPNAYRLRSDIASGIRSSVYGRYVIYFTADNDIVRIIRILHGAMDASGHLAV